MNAKPIFDWAKAHGESKIVDRILVRLLPDLLSAQLKVTSDSLDKMAEFDVSEELYQKIQAIAEELSEKKFPLEG